MIQTLSSTGSVSAPGGQAMRNGLAIGARALLRFYKNWRGRREMTRLAHFDDRLLKDIGVDRADIDWAMLQPWSVDPTQLLAERVQRRRTSTFWVRRLQHRAVAESTRQIADASVAEILSR